MNKTLLECPKCKRDGGLELLPWATGNATFGAISLFCNHCEAFMILKLSDAKEVIFTESE